MQLCWKYHSCHNGLTTTSLLYNRKVLKVMVDYFSIKQPQLWMERENNCLLFSYRGHWSDSGHIQSHSRNLSFLPPVLFIYLAHLYFSLVLLYRSILSLFFLISFYENLAELWYSIDFENIEFQHKHRNITNQILLTFLFFISEEAMFGLKKKTDLPL